MRIFLMTLVMAVALPFTSYAKDKSTVVVGVKGMVCAFCAQGIEKKFKAQKEVEKVEVSLEKKTVTLTFKPGQSLSRKKIAEIIADSGYEELEF